MALKCEKLFEQMSAGLKDHGAPAVKKVNGVL
jgi:hypothetical protein